MHHRQLVVMHRIHILEKPTLQFEKPLATQVPHLKLPSLLCGTVFNLLNLYNSHRSIQVYQFVQFLVDTAKVLSC